MKPTHDSKRLHSYEDVEAELACDAKVKIGCVDLTGILRGKVISKERLLSAVKQGFLGFSSGVFAIDMNDEMYDPPSVYSNPSNGFPDFRAHVDLSSFRRIPWERDLPFFMVDFHVDAEKPLPVCPRNLLKTHTQQLASLGLEPQCGIEFEWFNYKDTPQSLAEKGKPTPLTPGNFAYSLLRPSLSQEYFDDIFDKCKDFGIDLEALHTELGPGVFEASLTYKPALRMADNAVLFKTSVKQIAYRHGVVASFMAKPFAHLAGCAGHIHFSLKDTASGANAFTGEAGKLSGVAEQFIAGLVVALPSIMPLLAPTINSYKRIVENCWAPVKVSWGIENRLAAIRVIVPPTCAPGSTRFELRVSGADINPCLAIAAIVAAGHYGIKNKLQNPLRALQVGESLADYPGAPLPKSLKDATELLAAKGSVARCILGDEFVDHYALACRHEVKKWENAVTDWELKRYIELV